MKWTKQALYGTIILVFLSIIGLGGCGKTVENHEEKKEETAISYKNIPIELDSIKKVMGWLSNEEVLVHCGHDFKDVLYKFNVVTGELKILYKPNALILTSAISPDSKKIFIQLAEEQKSKLQVIDLEGKILKENTVDTQGYLNVSWNGSNNAELFLAYYETENVLKVLDWKVSENTLKDVPNDSLTPVWYSDNLYVYVDNLGEFLLTKGELYLGDVRTGKKTYLRNQVSGFYLNNDALITFSPSDFNEYELLLSYQYPFMVDKGFLEVPKMSMNDRLLFPYLSQAQRKAPIYGVLPKKAVHLELEMGEYQLAELDFEERKIIPILDLPDNAPIQVSPNGKRVLYGWRFENVADLKTKKIYPLLNIPEKTPKS